MRKLLWAGMLALPLLALSGEAKAFMVGNYEVDTGAKVWCNVRQFNFATPTCGPWYLYYPYEAYFRVPAPGVSPYPSQPMILPPGFGMPPPMMPPAQGYAPQMPAPGYRPPMPTPGAYQPMAPRGAYAQGYQPMMPQGGYTQGYQPTMPQGGYTQGYQPAMPQGGYTQGYQPTMQPAPYANWRAPVQPGIPHPDAPSYFQR